MPEITPCRSGEIDVMPTAVSIVLPMRSIHYDGSATMGRIAVFDARTLTQTSRV